MNKKAKIGEIWVVLIPRIDASKNSDEINVTLEKRPCLIIDDGRGFLIEENSNYAGLKLTTRVSNSTNVKRKKLINWKKLGLKQKSYLRIELPLKIEEQQLLNKLSKLSNEELKIYLEEFANYLNIEMLEILTNKQ